MKRWIAVLSVLGLFVIGILIGALSTHLFYARMLLRDGPPGPAVERFQRRLERELDLTPEQRRELVRILEEGRAEAESLRLEIEPRVRGQMERTRRRIEELLTPEQLERFERMHHRQRRRAERLFLGGPRGRRPPPPGGPPPAP